MRAVSPRTGLVAGAVTVSFAPVFVRVVSVSPTSSAFYRTLFGGALLFLLVYARGERIRIGRAVATTLALAGVLFAADLWTWHRSIRLVGPGLATLLGNFQVFFLALVGLVWFGERLRWQLAVAIPLALFGLSLIVGFDWDALGPDYAWGIGYGLLTAVFYTAYLLSLRRVRGRGGEGSAAADLALVVSVSTIALGLGAAAEGEALIIPTLGDGALLVGYAAVAQVLGWLLISSSLPGVPASGAGLILLLQPTLAFVWDVLFFARPFGPREAAGAALTLCAIWLGSRR